MNIAARNRRNMQMRIRNEFLQIGHYSIEVLVQSGADVNNKGDNGRTPLMMAAGNHDKTIIYHCLDDFTEICGRQTN